MAENFYTILTTLGKNKLANSTILGNKVNLRALQVGDGNGAYHEPAENQTALVNKVWAGNINSISLDESNSNWIVIQTIIPATDGGFFIREAGIFDEDGDLIAVSKVSETYKPIISEGSTKDVSIKIVLEVSNTDSIILKIDPNVIVATKNDIELLEVEMQEVNSKISNLEKNKANQSDLEVTNSNLSAKADDKDNTRTTTSKTVTGAINELNTIKASKDGTLQTNLNADLLDGVNSDKFAKLYLYQNSKDISDANSKEFFETNITNNINGPTTGSDWWHIINLPHCNGDGFTTQIAMPYGGCVNQNMFYRTSTGLTWNNWRQLATTETSAFPTLLNGWTFWTDSSYGARQITKVGNLCNIDVMVMSSSPNNSAIFTIPDGFKPIKSIVICGVSNSTLIPIDVYLDGTVRLKSTLPASNSWVHINATYPI